MQPVPKWSCCPPAFFLFSCPLQLPGNNSCWIALITALHQKSPTVTLAFQVKSKLPNLPLQDLIPTCFSGCIVHYSQRHTLCSSHAACLPTTVPLLMALPAISFSPSLPENSYSFPKTKLGWFFSTETSSHLLPHQSSVNFYSTLSSAFTCYGHTSFILLLWKLWDTGTMPLSSLHRPQHHAYSGHLMNADRKAVWSNRAWVLESESQVVEFSSVTDGWCGHSEPNSASVKWVYFLSCGQYREGDRCCKYPTIYTHTHTNIQQFTHTHTHKYPMIYTHTHTKW